MSHPPQDQEIVEDRPVMRSVAIMSPTSSLPAFPRATGFAKMAPSGVRFGAGIAAPKKASLMMQEPQDVGWKVPQQLATIPPRYVMERSHATLSNTTSSQAVADRISTCLREESIAATFHNDEALVEAETEDHVEFTVRLWSDEENQIVVELQRMSGCCFLFCRTAKAVLRAAKGMPTVSSRATLPLPACIPPGSTDEAQRDMEEGLALASSMLKSEERMDVRLLAMESLVQLSAASNRCCCFAAQCILNRGEFLSTLLNMIESHEMKNEASRGVDNELEQDHIAMMHRHALAVLANCFMALEKSGELCELLRTREELRSMSLLSALVRDVFSAKDCPHDACYALQCMKALVRADSCTKGILTGLGATQAVQRAHTRGQVCHARLANECSKFFLHLDGDM